MKLKYASVATLAAVSLLFSSCVYGPMDGYGTFTYSTNGYNSSVAWTNASYDANGFPIFGYSYGRPVYGYTAAGAAIFTVAALTALCFVPHWNPAPWYRGSWHYPAHIHRVSAPPRFPSGHRPNVRPSGGMNAPIHKNPGAVLHPNGGKPGMGNKPGANNKPGNRPNMGGQNGNRPGASNKPANNNNRPQMNQNRPGNTPNAGGQPGSNRPSMGGPSGSNRPSMGGQSGSNRPSMGGQSGGNRPQANFSNMGSRPGMASHSNRPSMGGNQGGAGGRGGHRR